MLRKNQTNSPASAASTKRFKSILSHFFSLAAVHNGVAGKKARQSENQPRHAADNRRSVAYFRRVKPESRAEAQKQQRSEDEQIFVPAYMPENLQGNISLNQVHPRHVAAFHSELQIFSVGESNTEKRAVDFFGGLSRQPPRLFSCQTCRS